MKSYNVLIKYVIYFIAIYQTHVGILMIKDVYEDNKLDLDSTWQMFWEIRNETELLRNQLTPPKSHILYSSNYMMVPCIYN